MGYTERDALDPMEPRSSESHPEPERPRRCHAPTGFTERDVSDPMGLRSSESPNRAISSESGTLRSISPVRLLDRGDVARCQQRQHQEDAGFLRAEILAGDDAAFAQAETRPDARLHWTMTTPDLAARSKLARCSGVGLPGANPAETIPPAPEATAAST